MEMRIKERFGGAYLLSILIKTDQWHGLKEPENLKQVEEISQALEKHPAVAGTMGIYLFAKLLNRFTHGNRDEYFIVPDTKRAIAEAFHIISDIVPGGITRFVDHDYQRTMLLAYVNNTEPGTVRDVMELARNCAQDVTSQEGNPLSVEVGGGSVAIANAFNENIPKWLLLANLLTACAAFLCVLVIFRSFIAGLLLLFPLYVGTFLFLPILYLSGIELNSNITTAMAIAMGMGIDAELYFLYKFRELYKESKEFNRSIIGGFVIIRKAIILSHVSLIVGCWALIPIPLYIGYVGYAMGMIIFACFLISFILPPLLWGTLKPRFLTRGLEVSS